MGAYTVAELAVAAGEKERTVRYYVQEGVLPSPGATGPGAHYDDSHLARLRLIRRMQADGLQLAEIRERLGALSEEAIQAEVLARSSALDYVRAALAGVPAVLSSHAPPASTRPDRDATGAGPVAPSPERSHWERIALAPGVELHIQRPLPRRLGRKVQELIDNARAQLEEEG